MHFLFECIQLIIDITQMHSNLYFTFICIIFKYLYCQCLVVVQSHMLTVSETESVTVSSNIAIASHKSVKLVTDSVIKTHGH